MPARAWGARGGEGARDGLAELPAGGKGKERTRGGDPMLGAPSWEVEQWKACCQVQPSCGSMERKAAEIQPSGWPAVCLDHGTALP